MFPIGDDNSDRERWPAVTAVLIAINVAIFLYQSSLDASAPRALVEFVNRWGVVPREFRLHADLPPQIPLPFWSTLVTSMFMHGGWGHLIGNMVYLWIFGDNVEDRFGRVAFVIFYLSAGVAGSIAQILVRPDSLIPTLGASGAISGVLGAYLVMFPRKRVRVLFLYSIIEVPAIVVLGLWAVTQFASGFGSLAARTAERGGVAYMAHVGGFVVGALAATVWRGMVGPPRPSPRPPTLW